MPLFNFKYRMRAHCYNCGSSFEISVPTGITLEDFLKSRGAKCAVCKCNDIGIFRPKPNKKPKGKKDFRIIEEVDEEDIPNYMGGEK